MTMFDHDKQAKHGLLRRGAVAAVLGATTLTSCTGDTSSSPSPQTTLRAETLCDIEVSTPTAWEKREHILDIAGVSLRKTGVIRYVQYDFYGNNFNSDQTSRMGPHEHIGHTYGMLPGVKSYEVQAKAHAVIGGKVQDIFCEPYVYRIK